MLLLGYDIGGTKIEAAVIEIGAEGTLDVFTHRKDLKKIKIRSRERRSTERDRGYEVVISNIVALTETVLAEAGVTLSEIAAMGFGLPGSVHPRTQKFLFGNTLIFKGRFIAHDVAEQLQCKLPTFSENDANCFALSEALSGAGLHHMRLSEKSFSDLIGIGVILGTGCGGGILIQGKLLRGKQGGGSEIGHSILKSNGHPCCCGNMGCAEQYLSGPALEASFMRRRYERIQHVAGSREIFELAHQGEPVALAVISRYKDYLSSFLGNLATIFDPDYFVLGGGLSDQAVLYEGLSLRVANKAFLKGDDIPVYPSIVGSSGGVLGAALLPILSEL